MLEVLDIPGVRAQVAPIAIDRYHRMIDSGVFDGWPVELLNGVLVKKMSKSTLHLFLVDFLLELLEDFCPRSEFWVRKEDPITIGNSEPEPDISVIRGKRSELRQTKPTSAEFVVEVAISSIAIDRVKAVDYATAGVAEYWIILPEEKKTEIYRTPANGSYSEKMEASADASVESAALPGFSFHLGEALQAVEDL